MYEGQLIPQGTIVFPNLTALHRDEDCYSHSEDFDPDRFLEDDLDAFTSASSDEHFKRDHFHYGFGRRMCQGIFVAEASLYIVISRVIWGFEITCDPHHTLDMAAKTCRRLSPLMAFFCTETDRVWDLSRASYQTETVRGNHPGPQRDSQGDHET